MGADFLVAGFILASVMKSRGEAERTEREQRERVAADSQMKEAAVKSLRLG
jgi:hypothetical protein